jgi:hypothetical protein
MVVTVWDPATGRKHASFQWVTLIWAYRSRLAQTATPSLAKECFGSNITGVVELSDIGPRPVPPPGVPGGVLVPVGHGLVIAT